MRRETRRSQSEISPERIEEFYVKNKLRFYQKKHFTCAKLFHANGKRRARPITTDSQKGNQGTETALISETSRVNTAKTRGAEKAVISWIERKDIRKELSDIAFGPEKSIQPS